MLGSFEAWDDSEPVAEHHGNAMALNVSKCVLCGVIGSLASQFLFTEALLLAVVLIALNAHAAPATNVDNVIQSTQAQIEPTTIPAKEETFPLQHGSYCHDDVIDFVESVAFLVADAAVKLTQDQSEILGRAARDVPLSHPKLSRLLSCIRFTRRPLESERPVTSTNLLQICLMRICRLAHFEISEKDLPSFSDIEQRRHLRQQLLDAMILALNKEFQQSADVIQSLTLEMSANDKKIKTYSMETLTEFMDEDTLMEPGDDISSSYLIYFKDSKSLHLESATDENAHFCKIVKATSSIPSVGMQTGDTLFILTGPSISSETATNKIDASVRFSTAMLTSLIQVEECKSGASVWTMRVLREHSNYILEAGAFGTVTENRVKDALNHGAVRVESSVIDEILISMD
ncbi:hypothetical protein BJ741DRAFT_650168 [Chytriomyces cf. hyalinus JEL632]|nr:hypothetical protein BJ741DRAFT_650168 [Chytriomyces cf. hyalinus JEL632]